MVTGDKKDDAMNPYAFGKLVQAVEDLFSDVKDLLNWKDKIDNRNYVEQDKCDVRVNTVKIELEKRNCIDPESLER